MTTKDIVINPHATEPLIKTGQWVWSNQTNQPSGSKQIRTDSGNWATAQVVAVSSTDNANADRTADLSMVKNGDYITLTGGGSTAKFIVTGAVPQAGYYTYAVTLISQAGSAPPNSTLLDASFQIAITGPVTKISAEFMPGTVNVITAEIGEDLIELIATALQTVSHLISQANLNMHMQSGPVISYTFTIAPAMIGEPNP